MEKNKELSLYELSEMNGQAVKVMIPQKGEYPANEFPALVAVSRSITDTARAVSIIAPDDDGEPLYWWADILIHDAKAKIYHMEV